jgi:hypothetical protein
MLRVFEEPARIAPTNGSLHDVNHVLRNKAVNANPRKGVAGTYVINRKVEVGCRDRLATKERATTSTACRRTAHTPARLLEDHHLLNHLLLIGVEEAGNKMRTGAVKFIYVRNLHTQQAWPRRARCRV